jgi:parvulin-like peptidyl-prolyl isomerase
MASSASRFPWCKFDKFSKCGTMGSTMILDIVVSSIQGTRDRDPVLRASIGAGHRWLLILPLVVLALVGCGGEEDRRRSAATQSPAVVVGQETVPVVTVEPSQGLPTAVPTEVLPTPTATPPAPLAALVNGEYVFLADYERRVAQYEDALLLTGLDPASEEGQIRLAQVQQDVLESLIDYVLIEQGAASLGVDLSEEELEAQVEADIAAGGGQAAFDEWLQSTGQTRDEYREMLRQSMLSQRVLEVFAAQVPAEIEQVHARHIMVDSEAAAQEILSLLQGGNDFVALARERSTDLATRENGGDLGWFPRGLVAPELENAAFALQPGQFSGIVVLGEGFHIIQVVEREDARPLSPEMQMDLGLALFDRWLEEQREAAAIERFVSE